MTTSKNRASGHAPLTRERVLRAAISQADTVGLEGLSMRGLAGVLKVAPMALYRHVANREDLIDAMIDVVFGEVVLPSGGADWKTAMRERGLSMRDVLTRHPWAIGLMESRRHPGQANLRHHDAVIGKLRSARFDVAMVAHAYSLLDSYIYGFAMTQVRMAVETPADMTAMAKDMFEPFPLNEYPNLAEFVNDHVMTAGYQYVDEYGYGLDRVLDAIERALADSGS
ncbi:TetR/AcrR family transcriptional regulator [Georgenia faecalis]|uniref:TetR/AcrR family transcriptional regulator n=1 Tax=Georgenia faecalis TaxID=2483799 RepID=UPI001F49C251|nr:TetR/AcrR family transcriptional regulator C-terminal domain-containing protein [Georgenia faecalis]